MQLSNSSASQGPLKDTGAESQLTVYVILNVDEYDCRILRQSDGQAVTLITGGGPGEGIHNIAEADHVLDLHADGPPIATQIVEINNQAPKYRAQLWSFIPVVQLPVEDGSYRIVNSQTGLVLDLSGNNANDPGTYTLNFFSMHLQSLTSFHSLLVHGLVSQSGVDQRVRR